MTSDEALTRLEPILRDLFDEYEGPITPDLTANDVEQWTSLAHIQLIVMVEKAFGMRFTSAEVNKLKDLGALASLVAVKAS